jgi:hypothetical protein
MNILLFVKMEHLLMQGKDRDDKNKRCLSSWSDVDLWRRFLQACRCIYLPHLSASCSTFAVSFVRWDEVSLGSMHQDSGCAIQCIGSRLLVLKWIKKLLMKEPPRAESVCYQLTIPGSFGAIGGGLWCLSSRLIIMPSVFASQTSTRIMTTTQGKYELVDTVNHRI